MERPPVAPWWRLFGGPGAVLPLRGAHHRHRDRGRCPSSLFDRATARHALAAGAQGPLDYPRPLRCGPMALSGRARGVLLQQPEPAARARARARSLPAAHELHVTDRAPVWEARLGRTCRDRCLQYARGTARPQGREGRAVGPDPPLSLETGARRRTRDRGALPSSGLRGDARPARATRHPGTASAGCCCRRLRARHDDRVARRRRQTPRAWADDAAAQRAVPRRNYRSRTDGAMGPGARCRSTSPSRHHAIKAIHSAVVKLPGTPGTTFIRTIATLTIAPVTASAVPCRSLLRRASAMKATHAAHQPIPETADPTSVIGTSSASPRSAAAAVSMVTSRIATEGVPDRGLTAPSEECTRPRRPRA